MAIKTRNHYDIYNLCQVLKDKSSEYGIDCISHHQGDGVNVHNDFCFITVVHTDVVNSGGYSNGGQAAKLFAKMAAESFILRRSEIINRSISSRSIEIQFYSIFEWKWNGHSDFFEVMDRLALT